MPYLVMIEHDDEETGVMFAARDVSELREGLCRRGYDGPAITMHVFAASEDGCDDPYTLSDDEGHTTTITVEHVERAG